MTVIFKDGKLIEIELSQNTATIYYTIPYDPEHAVTVPLESDDGSASLSGELR